VVVVEGLRRVVRVGMAVVARVVGLTVAARVGMAVVARVVGEMSGRQSPPSGARGIGGPEVTSWFLFWENGIPGIPFQACPNLPGSTIICLT
jgi:hypothetical protein